MMFLSLVAGSILICLSTAQNATEGYTDWMGRHRWYPVADIIDTDHPENCLKGCFDSFEFRRRIVVPCDIWAADGNQTHGANATCAASSLAADDDKAIYLSFRGTRSPAQMAEETSAYDTPVAFPGGGKVNEYYLSAFRSLWENGLRDDYSYFKKKYPTYEVRCTGHSLGGALAALAAGYLSAMSYVPPERLKMVSFGEPHVGDEDWASKYSSWVPWAYRVTHRYDHVPHWPYSIPGYIHHKTEIWYNNTMVDAPEGRVFTVCPSHESSNCIDSIPASIYTDPKWKGEHTDYFGKDNHCNMCLKNSQRPTVAPGTMSNRGE